MVGFTIGKLAGEVGVNVETVRYYERQRLIEQPEKQETGFRQYGKEHVDRIRFIKHAQELGFTLREIKELLDIRLVPDEQQGKVRLHAEAKIAEIDAKIQVLGRMKGVLTDLIDASEKGESSGPSPILEVLESEDAQYKVGA